MKGKTKGKTKEKAGGGKSIRRAAAFAAALSLGAAALCGCTVGGKGPQEANEIRVGVTLYDEHDTFIGLLSSGLAQIARETEKEKGVPIRIATAAANGDQFLQNEQVEAFIEDGCDVICVNLVDRTDATIIIDKAESAGIPLIFFNRELVEEDLFRAQNLYYVGAPASDSGRMQGEIVTGLLRADMGAADKNGDGVLQYVMIEGQAGHQDAILRTESSVKTLIGAGYDLEKLEDGIANWIRTQAETKMAQWLDIHDNIELVFANNDEMALGAIDALKKREVSPESWPIIVGVDGTPQGLDAVMAGEMAGTVLNDSFGQAAAIMDFVWYSTKGGALSPDFQPDQGKYIRIPYQPITRANVGNYTSLYD